MNERIVEDLGDGLIRVNLDPDRWYEYDGRYYPSVTWILESYPKDIGFHIWLSNLKDWDEGRQILRKAGDRGSKVHAGIEKLLRNESVRYDDFMPGHTDQFSPEEWTYLLAFINFYEDYPLTVQNLEETIINNDPMFGGTADFRGLMSLYKDNQPEETVLDWKTSSAIYPTHLMQVSAYAKSLDYQWAGIVRLGSRHKRAYELKILDLEQIEYYYNLFLNVYEIWKDQNQGAEPRYKEFKNELKLEVFNDSQDNEKKNNGRRSGQDQDRDEGDVEVGQGNTKEPRLF